jgi:hypothetical protein
MSNAGLCRIGCCERCYRRLFLLSEEFASVIHVLGRETGQLSPLLRCAWDGGDLCAHDGHRYIRAAAAHISIVGHVTQSELAHHLSHIESTNGFANRCLWTNIRRSKSLPDGGSLPPEQQSALACELRCTLDWVQNQNELLFSRTPAASQLWNKRYDALCQGRGDAYGAATSRAEAQVLRLSAIYAALDRSPLIDIRGTAAGGGRSASLWTKAPKPETGTNTPETDPYGA